MQAKILDAEIRGIQRRLRHHDYDSGHRPILESILSQKLVMRDALRKTSKEIAR